MATATATSNQANRNANSPNSPPTSPPGPSSAPSDRYFEVKTIVWILRILIILFVLCSHLSLSSRTQSRPGIKEDWRSNTDRREIVPAEERRGSSSSSDNEERFQKVLEHVNKIYHRPSLRYDYFVLNLQWGPDFVKANAEGSLPKLLNHLDNFDYGFGIHQFRIKRHENPPKFCDRNEERGNIRQIPNANRDYNRLFHYWPSFQVSRDKGFWWHEW